MSTTSASSTDDQVRTVTQTQTYTMPGATATVTMPPPAQSFPSESMHIPASLYFITLAVALSLVFAISAILVARTVVMRTRMRRHVAISTMTAATSSRDSRSKKSPVLWDVWAPSTTTGSEKSAAAACWSAIQPLTIGGLPTPPVLPTPAPVAAAPEQTGMERFLRLPAMPPGAEVFLPPARPIGYRFFSRVRRLFGSRREATTARDLEAGTAMRDPHRRPGAAGVGSPTIHNGGGSAMPGPAVEERDDVERQLEKPVRLGVLLAMPAGEVLLGTLDHKASAPAVAPSS